MKRKRIVRTAEVTIESEEKIVLSATKGRQTALMWCPACRRQVEMVTPELAARIADVSTRTIYRWVEGEKLHFNEVSDGTILICFESIHAAVGGARKSARHTSSQEE